MRFIVPILVAFPLMLASCGTGPGYQPDPSDTALRTAVADHLSRTFELNQVDEASLVALLILAQEHTVIGELLADLESRPELASLFTIYTQAIEHSLDDADVSRYMIQATIAAILAQGITADG